LSFIDVLRPGQPPPDDAALATLAAAVGAALRARPARIALAESCTGGWIAKVLTDVPGASRWFDRGFVTYSDLAKIEVLGVDRLVLSNHGAVSEPVVLAMAAGLMRYTSAGAAISVSGIAGPGGGTASKPVGLVWFGFALGERRWAASARFDGDREAVRRHAVDFALAGLLESLAD
jgi:nicotinamide-nucleotide amidase